MRRLTGFFILLILAPGAFAAFDYPAYSPIGAALANSFVTSGRFPSAFLLNPALSSFSGRYTASISYFRLFNMSELTYAGGTFTIPLKHWGFGAAAGTFGNTLYRESRLALNVSRRWQNNRFALGITTNFYNISAQKYSNLSTVGIDVGFRFGVSRNFWIAGSVENINQPQLASRSEELPQRIRIGFQYNPSPEIKTFVAVKKDAYFDPDLLLGVEVGLATILKIYSGFSLQSSIPSGGIRLRIGRLNINYALQYHFDLGTTQFVGISINPNF